MKFKDNLMSFFNDDEYVITIYDKYIHIFNYDKIVKISEEEMVLDIEAFHLQIIGSNLIVKQMDKKEILIYGKIFEVKKIDE